MRYDSGRGVSLISVSRRGRWVSGMPVKSGQALLVSHFPVAEPCRNFEPCFPTRSVLTFQAEDSHAWGRTSTVQSDITHSAYGFQPHQNDCTTSDTNRMGTTRHVPLTCRRIFELVWSASLRGAMSSILTIFFVKESFVPFFISFFVLLFGFIKCQRKYTSQFGFLNTLHLSLSLS